MSSNPPAAARTGTPQQVPALVTCFCGKVTQMNVYCPYCATELSLYPYPSGTLYFYKCGKPGCGHWDSLQGSTLLVRTYQAQGALRYQGASGFQMVSAEEQQKRTCTNLHDLLRFAENKIHTEQAEVEQWKNEAQRWKDEVERQSLEKDLLLQELKDLQQQAENRR
uniref:Zinc finger GRF-type domain-containing protein n=1 Tax=Mycena chlorophos TaxID=658473 RepID=A0ABQ0LR33_MYCCL|nr:predicted protein [Mycena chlorophos]